MYAPFTFFTLAAGTGTLWRLLRYIAYYDVRFVEVETLTAGLMNEQNPALERLTET